MNPEEQLQRILIDLIRQGGKNILLTNVTGRYKGNTGEINKILLEYSEIKWISNITNNSFTITDEFLLRLCPDLYFKGKKMKNYSLEERKKARLQLLNGIYDAAGGSLSSMVDVWTIGKNIGIDIDLIRSTNEYLIEKSYIKSMALGGKVSLTVMGLEQIEDIKQHPDKETTDLPPYNVILINSPVSGSGIQIGVSNSQQQVNISNADLGQWLKSLRNSVDQLSISKEDQEKLLEEIQEVESLSNTQETKKSKYLKIAWENIKAILQSAAGSAAIELLKNMPSMPL